MFHVTCASTYKTERLGQKHRQPGKPELAAGTTETPQRCCNVGGKLGLLYSSPPKSGMVSRKSRGSEKSTETHRQAGARLIAAFTSRSQNPIRTNDGPYHGHVTITALTRKQNKANASMYHKHGNARHHCITKTYLTCNITNTATHYTVGCYLLALRLMVHACGFLRRKCGC